MAILPIARFPAIRRSFVVVASTRTCPIRPLRLDHVDLDVIGVRIVELDLRSAQIFGVETLVTQTVTNSFLVPIVLSDRSREMAE